MCKFFSILFIIYFALAVADGQTTKSPILAALLPRTDQPYFELNSNGQTYKLLISHPDGSYRSENAELKSEGTPEEELHVQGEINEKFSNGIAQTFYEAGLNGYIVKYKYTAKPRDDTIFKPLALPAAVLKSTVG